MSIYFGTDGIRGEVNKELNHELCYKCGNAISGLKENAKVVLGRDTRTSGDAITLAFSAGLVMGGGSVVDVGVVPTACISYLVKKLGFDYGVVISASHNPPRYNGIKIFDANGDKINTLTETQIEKKFVLNNIVSYKELGSFVQKKSLARLYTDFLVSVGRPLKNLKIALDCCNGASVNFAPKIFRRLGARVVALNTSQNGLKINRDCGSLYPGAIREAVLRHNCHMGFAFDGDSDRVIAVDEKGNVLDGDIITYVLATHFKGVGELDKNGVVGTTQTNMGIINSLKARGIEFYASDVGDKYVIAMMKEKGLVLGGEQSGHIIVGKHLSTGDGILSAIVLASIVAKTKKQLSMLAKVVLMPQVNADVAVLDKFRVVNAQELKTEIDECNALNTTGRVVVRASGTENKIRVMVEGEDATLNKEILDRIVKKVLAFNA